ncbi:hypothetical protein IV203_005450 [Nitzschia inconspicua]|uniref:Uncharacterized protein n=1 Tax=Nitzschia inconspicua TaxID=303405 RepID=A0A9K3KMB1_9STRA|nr:hypothetical protein IV203_005450 [Nitzschia inconspicua]
MTAVFLTTMNRTLAKLLGRKAFYPKAVFPLAILVYLFCFVTFLVGVRHMNNQHALQQQQSDIMGYNGQMTNRALVQSSTSLAFASTAPSTELQYIHDRPVAKAPPVFLAMPTIPRANNADYLLKVLQSLENAKFPLSHTYVFYNGSPKQKAHQRWEEGETLFSRKGVHFLWNNAPVPPPHPAAYNNSIPVPKDINLPDDILKEARNDTVSRKDWRRKECNDFRIISQYMLQVVYGDDSPVDLADRDDAWIIFNQDDAQWMVEFYFIYEKLHAEPDNVTRYDISRKGLVSVAFRAKYLREIVVKAKVWCDFVPVDWMVWSCEDESHKTAKVSMQDNWVKHIGKISTREGVVQDPPAPPSVKEKLKSVLSIKK